MKFSWPVTIASLPCVLAACTGSTPVKEVDTPKAKPSIVHKSAPDATMANAGAARCSLQNVQHIGAFAKNGEFALGFGQHGGLVAWSSPEGLRIKPLSSAGLASGSALRTSFPAGTKPAEIVAVGRGFAVIAKRVETTPGPCEKLCGDKPCPDVEPTEAAPQTCEKPTGYEYFVQLTDLDGSNPSAGRPFHTGLVDIETILPGDGRGFGVMTKNEVVWIQKRPDGRLDSVRVELPSAEYVIPVHGFGPPAVLLVSKDGSMQLLDERGTNDIDGKFIGMQAKAAATPAPKPAGKPAVGSPPPPAAKSAGEMNFRSFWGDKGRIEIGRRRGDSTQFATIEKRVLHMLSDAESQSIRDSFAKSVEMHRDNGRLRRTGWDNRPIGDELDVHAADAAADTSRIRHAWSGSAFVFAHPSNPPHQPEALAVGIMTATCASEKP